MKLDIILNGKGREVATVLPTTTVNELLALLAAKRIGACVVSEDGIRVDGMVSERDVVRHLVGTGPSILEGPVSAIMTTVVQCAPPNAAVTDIMALMTERRVRHIPVVDDRRGHGGAGQHRRRRQEPPRRTGGRAERPVRVRDDGSRGRIRTRSPVAGRRVTCASTRGSAASGRFEPVAGQQHGDHLAPLQQGQCPGRCTAAARRRTAGTRRAGSSCAPAPTADRRTWPGRRPSDRPRRPDPGGAPRG